MGRRAPCCGVMSLAYKDLYPGLEVELYNTDTLKSLFYVLDRVNIECANRAYVKAYLLEEGKSLYCNRKTGAYLFKGAPVLVLARSDMSPVITELGHTAEVEAWVARLRRA